jgi:hypothetical protein
MILLIPEGTGAGHEAYTLECQNKMRLIMLDLYTYYSKNAHFPPDDLESNWAKNNISECRGDLIEYNRAFRCNYFYRLLNENNIKNNEPLTHYVRLSLPESITPARNPQCFILIETLKLYRIGENQVLTYSKLNLREVSHHVFPFRLYPDVKDKSRIVFFADAEEFEELIYYPYSNSSLLKCINTSKNIHEFHKNIKYESMKYNSYLKIIYFAGVFLYFLICLVLLFQLRVCLSSVFVQILGMDLKSRTVE